MKQYTVCDKRIDEIDVAKGIGIIMTILGHNMDNEYINTFIYSFHMPLFFVLTGLVMIKKEKESIRTLISGEKKLFSAYFFWSLIYMIYDVLVRILLFKQPVKLIFVDGYQTLVFWGINVLWFIATLAIAKVITYKLCMIVKKNNIQIILALVTFFGVYEMLPFLSEIQARKSGYVLLYYGLAALLRAFSAVIFIIMGMNLKKILFRILYLNFIKSLILSMVCLGCVAVLGKHMGQIDMHLLIYGSNKFLFLVVAFLGTIGVILISNCIVRFSYLKRSLSYIGKNSLFIMATHNYFYLDCIIQNVISILKVDNELVVICLSILMLFALEFLITWLFAESNKKIILFMCKKMNSYKLQSEH